jgi:3-hydroxybutyrate dehydrogenase
MTRNVNDLFNLQGKTALVTGGSRGLGLQMAHALGEAGARVMLTSRKAADLEAAAAELKAAGIDAQWIAADCGQEADVRRLADETLARLGVVDILVNNAGATWGAPAEDHPVAAWDKLMNLNVRGYFILSQHLAKHCMIPRQSGRIINIASAHGLTASPYKSAYIAAKHGVVGLSKTTALETAGQGITCNAICPGYVLTPLVEAQIPEQMKLHSMDRETVLREVMLQRQPSRQFATTGQLGGTVTFLCSESAAQITGTTISVDGGWTAL